MLNILHKQLHNDDAAVSARARAQLSQLSAEDLLTLLQMEMKRGRARRTGVVSLWLLLQLGIVAGFFLLFGLLATATHGGFGSADFNGNPFTTLPDAEPESAQLRIIADALGACRDPRAAAIIIELALNNVFFARRLSAALVDRLLEVRPEHAYLWNQSKRRHLLQWIHNELNEGNLKPAIAGIHAVEQIGAQDAITAMYRLTHHRNEGIRNAARRCREALQRRTLANRQGKELLRAGERPASSPGDLLRAASDSKVSTASELLRAGTRESGLAFRLKDGCLLQAGTESTRFPTPDGRE